jgi:hypothetical protein
MNTPHDNVIYSVKQYHLRDEGSFCHAFFQDSGASYALNDSGRIVLTLLGDGFSAAEIANTLAKRVKRCSSSTLKSSVKTFIEFLENERLVARRASARPRSAGLLDRPSLRRLESVVAQAKQCLTFGMPKRTCKALPSGFLGPETCSKAANQPARHAR